MSSLPRPARSSRGVAARRKPHALVVDASVLLAFYLPAEPYKGQALSVLAEATAGRNRARR